VPAVAGAAGDTQAGRLAARPSVTRAGTRFVLPAGGPERTTVDVLDVAGRKVRTLAASGGEVPWDGADGSGVRVPSGVYFARTDGVLGAARVVVLR
jgi:hypothetical protein